jgi:hypothetical protein
MYQEHVLGALWKGAWLCVCCVHQDVWQFLLKPLIAAAGTSLLLANSFDMFSVLQGVVFGAAPATAVQRQWPANISCKSSFVCVTRCSASAMQ